MLPNMFAPSVLSRLYLARALVLLGGIGMGAQLGDRVAAAKAETAQTALAPDPFSPPAGFDYIDTSFENASPLWYDFGTNGTINVHLLYDHERASPNRAAGHFHFLVQAKPQSELTFEFKNLDNVWNGRYGSVANELKAAVTSVEGIHWRPVALRALPGNRVQLTVRLPGPRLFIARVEPYRLSNLEQLLASIRTNPLVQIQTIGKTVQGRPLEILRLGNPQAPHRIFLRARAHAWEAGSSWVVEGFIRSFLADDDLAGAARQSYCAYILPMANKDGVAAGRTRFNFQGKDLNREWDKPADPVLAPENFGLEQWLESMIRAGQAPELSLEFHNDGAGTLHLSHGPAPNGYLERMATLERLLRRDTWFTEGSVTLPNPGSLGEGWCTRYGIDAAVHELNCNWIEGLKDYPSAQHWREYGADLVKVMRQYFGSDEGRVWKVRPHPNPLPQGEGKPPDGSRS